MTSYTWRENNEGFTCDGCTLGLTCVHMKAKLKRYNRLTVITWEQLLTNWVENADTSLRRSCRSCKIEYCNPRCTRHTQLRRACLQAALIEPYLNIWTACCHWYVLLPPAECMAQTPGTLFSSNVTQISARAIAVMKHLLKKHNEYTENAGARMVFDVCAP